MSTTPITIRFMRWQCSYRNHLPADIPCQSVDQVNLILQAISCAISQPGSATAAVFDATHGRDVYITSNYHERVGPLPEQFPRTTLYVGTQAEMAELHSPDLTEAILWELGGMPTTWDGHQFMHDMTMAAMMTAERAAELTAPQPPDKAPREPVCDIPPIILPLSDLLIKLRAEAAAQATEVGQVEHVEAGGAA